MGNLERRENDSYGPQNSATTLDVLSDLWSAVLHSMAAVEALANDSIDRLTIDASITIGKKDRTRTVLQPQMVRALNLDEKLTLAVPMLDGGEKIIGTRPWEGYRRMKGLRDDLVHVKGGGYTPRPMTDGVRPPASGRCGYVRTERLRHRQAARPGFLGDHVIEHLSR